MKYYYRHDKTVYNNVPLKFFKFYLSVRTPIIWIVWMCIWSIQCGYELGRLLSVIYLFIWPVPHFEMLNYDYLGYKLNKVLWIAEVIITGFSIFFSKSTILAIFLFIVFVIGNALTFIYFEKRKYLFDGAPQSEYNSYEIEHLLKRAAERKLSQEVDLITRIDKAARYQKRFEANFMQKVADILSIPKAPYSDMPIESAQEQIKPLVSQIADEVTRNGAVPQENADAIFDEACRQGRDYDTNADEFKAYARKEFDKAIAEYTYHIRGINSCNYETIELVNRYKEDAVEIRDLFEKYQNKHMPVAKVSQNDIIPEKIKTLYEHLLRDEIETDSDI